MLVLKQEVHYNSRTLSKDETMEGTKWLMSKPDILV